MGGVDVARNHGLDKARGKYIAFIDSDDAYEKDYLDILVTYAESSNVDMVTCSFIPFGVDSLPKFKLIPAQETDRNTAVKYLLGYNSLNGYVWNKLFKKSIIDAHSLRFEDGFWACDDVLFAGNYLYYCNRVKILENPLYRYRQNNSGANRVRYSGKSKFDKKWMSSFKVMSHFKKLYDDTEITKACNLHEVREAGIVLRSMAACDYHGPEYEKLRNVIRKYGRDFYKSPESSYFQKLSVWLTSISPKLELTVWKARNR